MSNTFNLVPIASAQSLDTLSQPTFGTIDVGSQGGALATVLLSSSSTATQVGQKFTVTIEIKTSEQQINEYKILIDYDSSKLTIIDQDTTTTGTQIKFLDTVFLIENQATDNIVSAPGRIVLLASTSSGSGLSVNRNIAQIEFQAQQIGSASIKVVQSSTGTQLLRTNGTSLSFTPNELAVQISSQTQTDTPGTQPGDGNTDTGNNGGTGDGGTIIPTPDIDIPNVIPNTAFESGIPILPLAAGLTFIGIGFALLKGARKRRGLES